MKVKIIFISFFLVLMSCSEDKLNTEPSTEVPLDVIIKTEEGLINAKNGIYYYLARPGGLGCNVVLLGDLISDNSFVNTSNTGRFLNLNNMSYNPELNFDGIEGEGPPLNRLYDAYALASTVINAPISLNDEIKQAKAEAYAARALAMFFIVNIYSPSVALGYNQEFGMPIYNKSYNPQIKHSRATIPEVYTQIENDLLQSLELFQSESSTKTHLGPTAVKLLLSRVYLYQQKWALAYEYAQQVESQSGGSFDFIQKENYVDYFSLNSAPETVFEIGYNQSNSLGINSLSSFYSITGTYFQNEFRKDLYNLYEDSDIRKNLLKLDVTNKGNNPTGEEGYYTLKYPVTMNLDSNVKILRMSESKLNKIEALYHLGNQEEALKQLNSFVSTRGDYQYNSKDNQLLKDILKERRLEFVGEGHQFFDLKRNRLPIVKKTNCKLNCEVSASDKLFVYPLPQIEIQTNPNIKQYPGY
ncbi:RagB/SusD family nutrient uptake outer membrane protein [Apibacter muscae]|uniref:RagB/SusD family nutrient uptake outer membrane protein n=1 Tax=Apibacter muscae TaxID=2509004 RepID=A0A563DJ48_9FLAO|nr:RagB/SusD family nutrient uptake outer membrane protein [Apibacter muscae]TWP29834.1 RagB/SusD family nutrient uptake outer membrane protein [Apibacter muscae]TWP30982.1 RagB/SusD family nutrient uptake outer membrane protein [Apibacter muscae]